jgi:hypothetical protein
MAVQTSQFRNTKRSKIIFLLSMLVAVIWLLGRTINIYRFAVVGAIFEILWLPVLAAIPVLTIMALVAWVKEKFNYRSFNLYAILLIAAAISIPLVFK